MLWCALWFPSVRCGTVAWACAVTPCGQPPPVCVAPAGTAGPMAATAPRPMTARSFRIRLSVRLARRGAALVRRSYPRRAHTYRVFFHSCMPRPPERTAHCHLVPASSRFSRDYPPGRGGTRAVPLRAASQHGTQAFRPTRRRIRVSMVGSPEVLHGTGPAGGRPVARARRRRARRGEGRDCLLAGRRTPGDLARRLPRRSRPSPPGSSPRAGNGGSTASPTPAWSWPVPPLPARGAGPLGVVGVVTAVLAVYLRWGCPGGPVYVTLFVALFSLATSRGRRSASATAAVSSGSLVMVGEVAGSGPRLVHVVFVGGGRRGVLRRRRPQPAWLPGAPRGAGRAPRGNRAAALTAESAPS